MVLQEDIGIVLRSQPFKERDRLVTLLTETRGKLTGIAKGAIQSRRFGAAFDLFNCIHFRFKDSPSQELVRIEEASIRRDFLGIRKKLENISAAGYFADLCLRLSQERHESRELFLLLTHYLYLLETETIREEIVRSFELKLLARLGYAPNLDQCVQCESTMDLPVDQHENLSLDLKHAGGFLCHSCTPQPAHPSQKQSFSTIVALRQARDLPIRETTSLKFSLETKQETKHLLQHFLRHHCPGLDRYDFRSKALLEQFLNLAPVPTDSMIVQSTPLP